MCVSVGVHLFFRLQAGVRLLPSVTLNSNAHIIPSSTHSTCKVPSAACVASLQDDSREKILPVACAKFNCELFLSQLAVCVCDHNMCDGAFHHAEAELPCIDSLSMSPPNIDTLPPETIVVHVLPYLTNGEKGALAKTCGRLFRLLRRERVYRLSSPCTRKYFEDAAFREEVNSRIPAGKLVLRPFVCAMRAFHFPPFDFKRARTLFEEALADESATELEKARAHLSLYVLNHEWWGGPDAKERHIAAAEESASILLCAGDECDPVRAFEMGYCHFYGIGAEEDYDKALSLFVSSANGGCAAGMYFLGLCLFYGWRVSRDESAGVAQWERAAAMGHFGAMHQFGLRLFYGIGVSRDEARGIALVWSAAVGEGSWAAKQWLLKKEDEIEQKGL